MSEQKKQTQHGQKKSRDISSLFFLVHYLSHSKLLVFFLVLLVLACNILALRIPLITGNIIAEIAKDTVNYSAILQEAGTIIVIALLVWGLTAIQNTLVCHVGQRLVKDLRSDVFDHLLHLPLTYFDVNLKGDIIAILVNDIDNISDTVSTDFITLASGLVNIAGSLIMMMRISMPLSSIFLITVPLMFVATHFISRYARLFHRQRKDAFGLLSGFAEEMTSSERSVKIYGLEEYSEERFDDLSDDLGAKGTRASAVSSMMMPSMTLLSNINFVAISIISALLAVEGKITIGAISTFILYSKRFSHPIIDATNILTMLQPTFAACDRINNILKTPTEEVGRVTTGTLPKELKGNIQVDHVNFWYTPEKQTLKDISFTIEPGQKVALVGETGSGKTTITSLLLQFYHHQSGSILLDGTEISTLPLEKLRSLFGLITQDCWLFQGTVLENLCYGCDKDIDREKVIKLCKEIKVDDFISALSDGYDTLIKTNALSVSQGQRQLLNIARAFLQNPLIYILDEATSSVDPQTEEAIQYVTDRVLHGKTSLIVAHRLSTVQNADCILVLKDGEIVERGTHQELLKLHGYYKEIYDSSSLT